MTNRLIRAMAMGIGLAAATFLLAALVLEWLQWGAPGFGPQQWAMAALSGVLLFVATFSFVQATGPHRNAAIFCVKLGVALILATIGMAGYQAVKITRQRMAERDRIPKVAAIQALLRIDAECGYLYRPNLNETIPNELQWLDADIEGITIQPITTDRHGFDNAPPAIASQDEPVDIIGLGDSFLDGAAKPFHAFFDQRGLRYHSYAMHRHCPPQYNHILSKYALRRQPRRVIYGIYENDFAETADFHRWQTSGIDWFTYHGGTWGGEPMSVPTSDLETQTKEVLRYAIEAFELCEEAGIEFTVWLIPGKDFVVENVPTEVATTAYDRMLKELQANKIAVLDLRPLLAKHPNPETLFWKQDAHWSHAGMRLAAEAYWGSLNKLPHEDSSRKP